MIVVPDTSAITNLYQIDQLHLLKDLFGEVLIPPAVLRELSALPEQATVVSENLWIRPVFPENHILVQQLSEQLDLGESEAIAVALEVKADRLILDEKLGRAVAREYDLPIIGILGILIEARKKGLLPEIRPEIIRLRENDFRLKLSLVNRVLMRLGEEEILA